MSGYRKQIMFAFEIWHWKYFHCNEEWLCIVGFVRCWNPCLSCLKFYYIFYRVNLFFTFLISLLLIYNSTLILIDVSLVKQSVTPTYSFMQIYTEQHGNKFFYGKQKFTPNIVLIIFAISVLLRMFSPFYIDISLSFSNYQKFIGFKVTVN